MSRIMRYPKPGRPMTAEELARLDIPGKVTELVRGQLIVREPPGTSHGRISATLCFLVSGFVRREKLGAVFAQDTGFKIESNPDTVRAPDVAYLSNERMSAVRERGYAAVAPDLAVEVLSPDDRASEILTKVQAWLAAGTMLVWVVDPDRKEVRAYRPTGSVTIVTLDGSIVGEDVLPGFACTVREIFS
jgi:Uma2 family endonuclease